MGMSWSALIKIFKKKMCRVYFFNVFAYGVCSRMVSDAIFKYIVYILYVIEMSNNLAPFYLLFE